ncbi:MAG: hypothetical protein QXO40_03325 [Candidatus Aenigmatarchaeota archaeon]
MNLPDPQPTSRTTSLLSHFVIFLRSKNLKYVAGPMFIQYPDL